MGQDRNIDMQGIRQGTFALGDPGEAEDAFASVGLAEEPVPPSQELRSRLAATLEHLPRRG